MKRCLALLLVLTCIAGIALAAEAAGSNSATASGNYGVNYIERMGIGFSLKDAIELRKGDVLESKIDSRISLISGNTKVLFNEKTVLKVSDVYPLTFELETGEVFIDTDDSSSVILQIGGSNYELSGCTAIADVQTGSSSLSILRGHVSDLEAGKRLSIADGVKSEVSFDAQALNDFAIGAALSSENVLCFDNSTLNGVTDAREAERLRALSELETHKAEILAQGGTVEVNGNGSDSKSSSDSKSTDSASLECTIQIRCDTILDNMENLIDGKNAYVPENGTILATSPVAFTEGETVFDVLKRVCSAAGIQLEYSYTPMYNSYYVEGINQLYEFDCGSESGWMYKVNGWFPNYGCSAYTLKNGDAIVWCYTCNGLGADVGGSVY